MGLDSRLCYFVLHKITLEKIENGGRRLGFYRSQMQ